jgi:hypothetical protein
VAFFSTQEATEWVMYPLNALEDFFIQSEQNGTLSDAERLERYRCHSVFINLSFLLAVEVNI